MSSLKTHFTNASVSSFLDKLESDQKRKDSELLIEMMQEITGEPPKMFGSSIIGFGTYHYRYASGHEGNAPFAGFSPRKQSLSVYLS